ncbi:MAG: PilZ domain-containing protein [Tepidisphaerales bacterium]
MLLKMHDAEIEATDEKPERRRGFRIPQDRPVKVYEPAVGRYYGGKTHDLSGTGLRIELPVSTPLVAGRIVNLHIGNYEPGESLVADREMVPARVIWLDRNDMVRGRLLAGVQLLKRAAMAMDAA